VRTEGTERSGRKKKRAGTGDDDRQEVLEGCFLARGFRRGQRKWRPQETRGRESAMPRQYLHLNSPSHPEKWVLKDSLDWWGGDHPPGTFSKNGGGVVGNDGRSAKVVKVPKGDFPERVFAN